MGRKVVLHIVAGITAVILISSLTLTAWLLWPLPSVEFDWKQEAEAKIEAGECAAAVDLLVGIFGSFSDLEAFEMLRMLSHGELCDFGESFEPTDIVDRWAEDPGVMAQFSPDNISFRGSLRVARVTYDNMQTYRAEFSGANFNWDDLVVSARCSRAFDNPWPTTWYSLQTGFYEPFSNPSHLASWDNRASECVERIENQLAELAQQGASETEAGANLIWEYEFLQFSVENN